MTHPEAGPGEVWTGNFTAFSFERLDFVTKRPGTVPCSVFDGQPVTHYQEPLFPVFVAEWELSRKQANWARADEIPTLAKKAAAAPTGA